VWQAARVPPHICRQQHCLREDCDFVKHRYFVLISCIEVGIVTAAFVAAFFFVPDHSMSILPLLLKKRVVAISLQADRSYYICLALSPSSSSS
jgi:hypothetical protein